MRLAACALSAVLLSGCSWLGSGGGYSDSNGYGYNGVYNNCMTGAGGAGFANSAYGYTNQYQSNQYMNQAYGGSTGCAPGGSYAVAHQGHAGMHGAGSGLRGQYGVNAYGTGLQGQAMYGQTNAMSSGMYGTPGMTGTGVTMLNGAAPYGSAVSGTTYGAGSMVTQGSNVKTVQGAPIYVAQPYPAYYQAGGGSYNYGGYSYQGGGYGYGYGGGMPFGLELDGGTSFGIGGDFFPGEDAKTTDVVDSTGTVIGTRDVSSLDSIAYDDAFKSAKAIGLTATYDVSPNTTLLGRVGYSKAEGNDPFLVGTVTEGGVTEDLYAEFSDLEQYTVEGGFRHYMGQPTGMRPYVGATAGFVKTEDVTLTQSSDTLIDPAFFQQTYVDGGWSPTASGIIGAEWAMGPRSAIGVETGIRWTDDLDTNFVSDSQLSVPLRLRGRMSF